MQKWQLRFRLRELALLKSIYKEAYGKCKNKAPGTVNPTDIC
jgi:hypothetical protein